MIAAIEALISAIGYKNAADGWAHFVSMANDKIKAQPEDNDFRNAHREFLEAYWENLRGFAEANQEARRLLAIEGMTVTPQMEDMARATHIERHARKPLNPALMEQLREFAEKCASQGKPQLRYYLKGLPANCIPSWEFYPTEEMRREAKRQIDEAKSSPHREREWPVLSVPKKNSK